MKIAVHYTTRMNKDSYTYRWIEELEKRNVNVLKINLKNNNAIDQVRDCDGVMWHWIHIPEDKQAAPKILTAIEKGLSVPVFPDYFTRWTYDDKAAQFYFLKSINAPIPETWIFYEYTEALDFLKQTDYPIVFKLVTGASSSNVKRLINFKQAKRMLNRMFGNGIWPTSLHRSFIEIVLSGVKRLGRIIIKKHGYNKSIREWHYILQKDYIYLQEYLPDNMNDIRITVIGNRAFGYIRYNRTGDFRASGSGNFSVDPKKIPLEAIKIALDISKKFNFQSMAYDFLFNKQKNLCIAEISYCYVNWMVQKCPGYWDRDLQWHEGHIWPEQAHVEDFITYISNRKNKK